MSRRVWQSGGVDEAARRFTQNPHSVTLGFGSGRNYRAMPDRGKRFDLAFGWSAFAHNQAGLVIYSGVVRP